MEMTGHNTIGIDTATGVFDMQIGGKKMTGIRAVVRYSVMGDDREEKTADLILEGSIQESTDRGCVVIIRETGELATRFHIRIGPDSTAALWAEIKASGVPCTIRSIELVRMDIGNTFMSHFPGTDLRFFRDWHYIWDQAGTTPISGSRQESDVADTNAYQYAALYHKENKAAMTFMYKMPNQWLSGIRLDEGSMEAKCLVNSGIRDGAGIVSDTLCIRADDSYVEALNILDSMNCARRHVEETGSHSGWNTWDYYKLAVTPEDIRENMAEISKIPWLKDQIRYITIDDGWQVIKGDWEPNEKFAGGMKELADEIRANGFVPGIWTSPLLVCEESATARNHPGWLLKDDQGPVKIAKCNLLDATHPEVRDYVYDLYRRLYGWGYRYFKTDFLCYAIKPCVPGTAMYNDRIELSDKDLGIMRGMRSIMETMRAAMGPDSYWLGCGTDVSSGAGIMDASRVSGDIAPFWTRVVNQARSVIHHLHYHGNLFTIDPDFVIVRGSDTFDRDLLDIPLVSEKPFVPDAWQGGKCFDEADARSWAGLVILSGGIVNLSDRIRGLNQKGLSIIRTVLDYAGGEAAIPIDTDQPIPGILYRLDCGRAILGIFNWSDDQTKDYTVLPEMGIEFPQDGRVRNIWDGETIRLDSGGIRKTLNPHESWIVVWDR